MIPKYILDGLAEEDLPHLLEMRDYLDRLIMDRRRSSGGAPPAEEENGEKRRASVTYRQEWVRCGKECRSCPHGPYWYCYWKEDGKTKTRYIGKVLKEVEV